MLAKKAEARVHKRVSQNEKCGRLSVLDTVDPTLSQT